MKTNFYKITLFLLFLIMGSTAFSQKNILWVSGAGTAFGKFHVNDSVLVQYLENQGYTINFLASSDFKDTNIWANPASYADYDALFFSEVVGSGDVLNYRKAGFPIPCVTTEGYGVRSDKWGWLTDNATQFKQLSSADATSGVFTMIMEDADNWISSNYEPDYELLWSYRTDLASMGVTGFQLDAVMDATVLASFNEVPMADFPCMWAIEEGTTVTIDLKDVVLPANIVVIGAISIGMKESSDEFCQLVMHSFQWVTGDYVSGIDNIQSNNLSVFPNPTNGIVNISFAGAISGNVNISFYDITGKLVKTMDYSASGSNTFSLDLSNIASGQYIYKLITENEVLSGQITKN